MRARVIRALRGGVRRPSDPSAARARPLAAAALAHAAARGWSIDTDPQTPADPDHRLLQLLARQPAAGRLAVPAACWKSPRARRRALPARGTAHAAGRRKAIRTLPPTRDCCSSASTTTGCTSSGSSRRCCSERGHWLRFVAGERAAARSAQRVNESLAALTRARLAALCALVPAALRRARAGAARLRPARPGAGRPRALEAPRAPRAHPQRRLAQAASVRTGSAAPSPTAAPCAGLRELIDELRAPCRRRRRGAAGRQAARPPAQLSADGRAAIAGALARAGARGGGAARRVRPVAQRVDYTYVTRRGPRGAHRGGRADRSGAAHGLALRHILVDEFQDTSLAQLQLLGSSRPAGRRATGAPCSSSATRCSRSTAFGTRRWGCSSEGARRAGIGRVRLTPLRLTRNFRAVPGAGGIRQRGVRTGLPGGTTSCARAR